MTSPENLLVQLTAMAETPLYSAYRWLESQMGRELSFSKFISLISRLLNQDVLRVWQVDSGDRTEVYVLPSGLEAQYEKGDHADPAYDPFGYSLSIGPKASVDAEPPWDASLDFEKGQFEIHTKEPDIATIVGELSDLLGVKFTVEEAGQEEGRYKFRGMLSS